MDEQVCEDDAVVEDIVDEDANERDEKLSQAIGQLSYASKQSKRSKTSKATINNLVKQLEQEKQARLKLEREIKEMKKLNAEISSKLGLSNAEGTPAK